MIAMAVYFVQAADGGPIKIGTSVDVRARLKQLELAYKRPLAMLAEMPGGREEEGAIHERFSHLRIGRTEQFRPGPDLLEFIGRPLFAGGDVEPMKCHVQPTVLNVKGSRAEKEYLQRLSKVTGVSLAEMTRRAVATWAESRALPPAPEGWISEWAGP